jgi:hypothetical protein
LRRTPPHPTPPSSTLCTHGRLGYNPGPLLDAILPCIEAQLRNFESQSCTNLLWALGVFPATRSRAFLALLEKVLEMERSGEPLQGMQYCQVLQAVLLGQFEAGEDGMTSWRPELDLPETMVDKALMYWTEQQKMSKLSAFHLEVSDSLRQLGIDHTIEFLTASDLFSLDIAVVSEGERARVGAGVRGCGWVGGGAGPRGLSYLGALVVRGSGCISRAVPRPHPCAHAPRTSCIRS